MLDNLPQHFTLCPTDRFIVSFPRSGNTWLRLLVGHAACYRNGNIPHVDQIIPDIHSDPFAKVQATDQYFSGRRVLKSHNIKSLPDNDVIYLFRKPEDSLISYYFFNARYKKGQNLEKFLEDGPDAFCLQNAEALKRHLSDALDERRKGRKMFLSYETLLNAPFASVTAALSFFGIPVSPVSVDAAVTENRFEQLQQSEQANLKLSFPFFRVGRAGDGCRHLTAETLERIDEMTGSLYGVARQRECELPKADCRRL